MEMSKPSDHPGFKKLLAVWNQKLSQSKFEDIETNGATHRYLKKSGTDWKYEAMPQDLKEIRAEYYRRLEENIKNTAFENDQESQIMNLYSQGMSQVEIKRCLRIQGHRKRVYGPIYKWLKRWGLK